MPRKRQDRELWQKTRRRVWERDGGMCQYPYGKHPVSLDQAHIDHIRSGKLGTNVPLSPHPARRRAPPRDDRESIGEGHHPAKLAGVGVGGRREIVQKLLFLYTNI
jgi:5-methylcytosine-specific restriction endonuclease McrA